MKIRFLPLGPPAPPVTPLKRSLREGVRHCTPCLYCTKRRHRLRGIRAERARWAMQRGSELSASCGRVSETENGQEQGELRTAVSKATLFQPEWPCVAGEVDFAKQKTEGVKISCPRVRGQLWVSGSTKMPLGKKRHAKSPFRGFFLCSALF